MTDETDVEMFFLVLGEPKATLVIQFQKDLNKKSPKFFKISTGKPGKLSGRQADCKSNFLVKMSLV